MEFYEIWVSSSSLHSYEPLTYSSNIPLNLGEIVVIQLRNNKCLGIVKSKVNKPKFKTKELTIINSRPTTSLENLKLIDWLIKYYPAPIGRITSLFIPSNLNSKSRKIVNKVKQQSIKNHILPKLTSDQSSAIKEILKSKNEPILLHGDTGTGKTRVYLEMAKKTIKENKSVIILTPEIGLTPQLIKTFSSIFPEITYFTHSGLTQSQKRDIWLELSVINKPFILIGPRSALFMPTKNVGLVVVDEFHDGAYKQDQSPHYVASRVAAKLSRIHNAKLILGSATPNISDYFSFHSKKLPIIRMTNQAVSITNRKTEIEIVNLSEKNNFSKSFWISNQLIDKISKSLQVKEQSLLFLNRRGTARISMCNNCQWQAICPKCDIPLTYHGDLHILRCHTCGFKDKAPSSCPECGSIEIQFKGVGTKTIYNEIQSLFPEATIARFDGDNIKNERLNFRYEDIINGKIDILIGTQTLTKGLDLPNLSVVGVITADTALYFPDYTAEEITYQQLSQVIGRVGRGHKQSSVIIQTYYSDNPALKAIVNKNYSLFYEQQILEREKFHFPPYFYILKLTCSRKSFKSSEISINKLYTFINNLPLSIEIIGPSPSFKQKQNDLYYWQLIIKSKKRENLTYIVRNLPGQFSYDIDPTNLL